MIRGLTSPGYDRVLGDPRLNTALGEKDVTRALGEKKTTKADKLQQLSGLAKDFESIFMNIVMTSMRQTIHKAPYFDGGFAEQVWTQQLDQELSKVAAERRQGFGLAAQIVKKYAKHVS